MLFILLFEVKELIKMIHVWTGYAQKEFVFLRFFFELNAYFYFSGG